MLRREESGRQADAPEMTAAASTVITPTTVASSTVTSPTTVASSTRPAPTGSISETEISQRNNTPTGNASAGSEPLLTAGSSNAGATDNGPAKATTGGALTGSGIVRATDNGIIGGSGNIIVERMDNGAIEADAATGKALKLDEIHEATVNGFVRKGRARSEAARRRHRESSAEGEGSGGAACATGGKAQQEQEQEQEQFFLRKQELHRAAMESVEEKLRLWRRKRARAEAGLPEETDRNYSGNCSGNCPAKSSRSGYYHQPTGHHHHHHHHHDHNRPSTSDGGIDSYPGAAGRSSSLSSRPGCSGCFSDFGRTSGAGDSDCRSGTVWAAWPEVFNAPVRPFMPGQNRRYVFCKSGGKDDGGSRRDGGGGGSSGGAPWMERLEDRWTNVKPGSFSGDEGGVFEGEAMKSSAEFQRQQEEEDDEEDFCYSYGGGASEEGANAAELNDFVSREGRENEKGERWGDGDGNGDKELSREGARNFGGKGGRGGRRGQKRSRERGGGRGDQSEQTLSDLHHEIVRFSDYVSLTSPEVRYLLLMLLMLVMLFY